MDLAVLSVLAIFEDHQNLTWLVSFDVKSQSKEKDRGPSEHFPFKIGISCLVWCRGCFLS
jgi:hypothetical protein